MDDGATEAEWRDADDRLVKRRCKEGFLSLRARADDAEEGAFRLDSDTAVDKVGIDGRRCIGVGGALPVVGNCISARWGVEDRGRLMGSTIIGDGGDKGCSLLSLLPESGKCEEEGAAEENPSEGVASESVDDDNDGGEFGFTSAGLTEFERDANESSSREDADSDDAAADEGGSDSFADNGDDSP